MTARPIIFSAPMVLALLAGRKTQTRRVLKPQPLDGDFTPPCTIYPQITTKAGDEIPGKPFYGISPWDGFWSIRLPAAPGDQLWVKEQHTTCNHGSKAVPDIRAMYGLDYVGFSKADGRDWNWTSPRFMPRWASRLTLTVTDVRVEQLQAISEADAVTEGAEPIHNKPGGDEGDPSDGWISYRDGFERLWNSINGPDAWAANPWVVALTFTVEQRNIDQ